MAWMAGSSGASARSQLAQRMGSGLVPSLWCNGSSGQHPSWVPQVPSQAHAMGCCCEIGSMVPVHRAHCCPEVPPPLGCRTSSRPEARRGHTHRTRAIAERGRRGCACANATASTHATGRRSRCSNWDRRCQRASSAFGTCPWKEGRIHTGWANQIDQIEGTHARVVPHQSGAAVAIGDGCVGRRCADNRAYSHNCLSGLEMPLCGASCRCRFRWRYSLRYHLSERGIAAAKPA